MKSNRVNSLMPPKYDHEKKTLHLSVGDLLWEDSPTVSSSTDFTNRSKLGQHIHQLRIEKQAFKYPEYTAEFPLTLKYDFLDTQIFLHGRIDGYWEEDDLVIIEEIKSIQYVLSETPSPKHLQQCEYYCLMYKLLFDKNVRGLLTRIDIKSGEINETTVPFDLQSVKDSLETKLSLILQYLRDDAILLEKRSKKAHLVKWPYPDKRPVQDKIEKSVESALEANHNLLLEAPTGCGKTAPILLTALRWCIKNRYRLAYATSRTAQQEDRVKLLEKSGATDTLGRVIVLGAADKLCSDPYCECRDSNNLRQQHRYSRCEWMDDAWKSSKVLSPEILKSLQDESGICARDMQRTLAGEADVIIGDQNLLIDPFIYYSGWFKDNKASNGTLLLVDEAHGTPDRIRDRFSGNISLRRVKHLLEELDQADNLFVDELRSYLTELMDRLVEYSSDRSVEIDTHLERLDTDLSEFSDVILPIAHVTRFLSDLNLSRSSYEQTVDFSHVEIVIDDSNDHGFGKMSAYAVYFNHNTCSIHWELVDQGRLLANRWSECQSVVAFSATLSPIEAALRRLGFKPENTQLSVIPSLFSGDQQFIIRYSGISTKYKDRISSLIPLSKVLISAAKSTDSTNLEKKNWAVFFPSYGYMESVYPLLQVEKGIKVILAGKNTPFPLIKQIVSDQDEQPALILMPLGGQLAEGTGLESLNLAGITIVGPGHPPVNERNELTREWYDEHGEDGYLYAYTYPGLTKVIQACGRLIRSESDRGIILLIGKRYSDPDIVDILPEIWHDSIIVNDRKKLEQVIQKWSIS